MSAPADTPPISDRDLRDLSALADGTLDPARREEVQARISASPELTELLERERGVVELLHEARARDRAPAGLRARIDSERPRPAVAARRRLGYGGALAGALAVLALALALILPGGTPGAPTVSEAAALAAKGPALPAPGADPTEPGKLASNVEDLYFPNWTARFGWRASGERTDRLNGRAAVTVYYDWVGRRLAYTIVASPVLAAPRATATVRRGVELRTLMLHGRLVVTWRQDNHTCLLSGQHVSAAELQRLAAWEASSAA
jgi:anti-sigma factor RsiW